MQAPDMDELLRLQPTASYGDDVLTQGRGGALHLSSVLPALSAAIGHPVATAVHKNPKTLQQALGFPDVSSAIVVLVDGLGFWNLVMRQGHAAYLRSLLQDSANARPICTCAPSTTVAAMGVFGTGTCPGLTGMLGYTQRNALTGRLCQLIQFKDVLDAHVDVRLTPHDLQREATVFEQLASQGVRATTVGLEKFRGSALTEAALRGGEYIVGVTPRDRVTAAARAASEPGLTYLYMRDADKVGHNHGVDSDQWVASFEHIDYQLANLKRQAPKGTLIVITADHGMVNSDETQRIDIAKEQQLNEGVAMVGGEPRSLMLYADEGVSGDDIAGRWAEFLGERALVRTKAQALADGLFGNVADHVLLMVGDVIVQAVGHTTIVDSRTQTEKAMTLPSVHGSQTMLEMDIPCLIDVV